MTCNRMLKEPTKMASNKTLHNPWNCTLLIFDIPRLLIYVSMIQLHLSSANCTTRISSSNKQTFYLVHGVGHGAWCWFKLVPLLEAAGHKVTTIDLSASGINTKHLQDLRSFNDYSAPLLDLMDSLPLDEKVVLVGHSFGGMSISLAMDMYPNKISVAIFVSAFLPDTTHVPSYVLATFLLQLNTTETLIDTQLYLVDRPNQTPLEAILFGPDALKYSIYHLSPPEVSQPPF
ncbi:hypothetical protein Leryth_027592 [Lithospermum erythrorhizon]|nr:hypothetical protein Leryth_027592 [Lithospermum erythrorhizon]